MPFLTNEEFELKIKRSEELIKLILQKITDPDAGITASRVELQAELEKHQAELDKFRVELQTELDKLQVEHQTELEHQVERQTKLDKFRVEHQTELDKFRAELAELGKHPVELDKHQVELRAELRAELVKQQVELHKLLVPLDTNEKPLRVLSNSISTFYSNREQNNKTSLAIFGIGLATVFAIAALAILLPISTPALTIGIAALSTSIVLIPLTYALIKRGVDWVKEKRKTSTEGSSENKETNAQVSSALRNLGSSAKTHEEVESVEPPRDSQIFASSTPVQPELSIPSPTTP